MPLVQDYISHFTAPDNYPFKSDYTAALALYLIEVTMPTSAPDTSDIFRIIYSTIDDAPIASLLWMTMTWVYSEMDPVCIVLIHSVSQFVIRLG